MTEIILFRPANRLEEDGISWTTVTEKPCHDANEAFEVMLAGATTTLPGLLAKLAHLRSIMDSEEAWWLDDREGVARPLIDSFAASLRNIGLRGV